MQGEAGPMQPMQPIQDRWSAVVARFGGAARMGKPSMPKHIVVHSMWTVCFTIHFTGLHDMPVDILA